MQIQSIWPVSYTHLDVYKRQEAYSKVGDTEYFSGKSDAVSAVTNLAQPALVSAKPVSATQIRVDWNPVENAQGYRIYRKEAGSSEWVMVDVYKRQDYMF